MRHHLPYIYILSRKGATHFFESEEQAMNWMTMLEIKDPPGSFTIQKRWHKSYYVVRDRLYDGYLHTATFYFTEFSDAVDYFEYSKRQTQTKSCVFLGAEGDDYKMIICSK